MTCNHHDFDVSAVVNRILKQEGNGPPVRFNVDLRVRCRDCNLPFRFIGLPHGIDLNGAAVSADGEEGRFCIAPKGEALTMLDGTTGFTARTHGVNKTKMPDPHSEEYGIWCEWNACPSCGGVGEDYIEDEWNAATQSYGVPWTCAYCDGTGIDPSAEQTPD